MSDRPQRRLAAIVAADVAGYSRLIGQDEEGTLAALRHHRRELIDPLLERHGGRIANTAGDSLLMEFPSVVDAMRCVIAVQTAMAERNADIPSERRIAFRVGVNLGDVVVEDGDIHGDGVNIAARLEGFCAPGEIAASAVAVDEVRGRVDAAFEDAGTQSFKNIARPIRVWRWRPGAGAAAAAPTVEAAQDLAERSSIAVLPFTNMSGDAEQEYFADGIVEDIITELSRAKWLFVIARNSSFAYKGRAVDIKQVGRELGVRYVLEGSVRKAGRRIRITGQLIAAATGAHLWADRFDGELEDVFDLQDRVTESVVGAIAPRLELAEIDHAKNKPTHSLDAYDHYLRGMAAFHAYDAMSNAEALRHFTAACALDPAFAAAWGMAARSYAQRKGFGWGADGPHDSAEALRLARTAVARGADDAIALAAAGFALVVFREVVDGDACLDRALTVNPNLAWAWHMSGFAKALIGEPEAAIENAGRAMRLSPQDPQHFAAQAVVALGHLLAGRPEKASEEAEAALRRRENFLLSAVAAAAGAALAGRSEPAERACLRIREIAPSLKVGNLLDWLQFQREADVITLQCGLRRAGLPE